MALRLETVDVQHPNLVALMRGPLVLFAIVDTQPSFEHTELLRAKPASNDQGDWLATSIDGQPVTMRPFVSIDKEKYSTYVRTKGLNGVATAKLMLAEKPFTF